jgi:hypothetical protein
MFFTEDGVNLFSLDFLRSGGVYYGGFLGGFRRPRLFNSIL